MALLLLLLLREEAVWWQGLLLCLLLLPWLRASWLSLLLGWQNGDHLLHCCQLAACASCCCSAAPLPLLLALPLLLGVMVMLYCYALAAACHLLLQLLLLLAQLQPPWVLLGLQLLQLLLLLLLLPMRLLCVHVRQLLLLGQQGSLPCWHHCLRCLGPPSRLGHPPWLLLPPLLLRLVGSAGLQALEYCANSCRYRKESSRSNWLWPLDETNIPKFSKVNTVSLRVTGDCGAKTACVGHVPEPAALPAGFVVKKLAQCAARPSLLQPCSMPINQC
jgi:hypothetical protein